MPKTHTITENQLEEIVEARKENHDKQAENACAPFSFEGNENRTQKSQRSWKHRQI